MRALSSIFGLHEDATEAEVHARLLEEEALISDLRAQISTLEGSVRELRAQVDGLIVAREETEQRCVALEAALEEAKATASNLGEALEAQRKENVALAAEVVRLRSGQKGPEAVALDADEHLHTRRPASGGMVFDATDLFSRLLKNKSN
ncbi:MAG: hypothetical protein NZM41_01780 [Saprospiraceae bacterium]|nr:hypothetical protein [Saprospiraceae bacterium]